MLIITNFNDPWKVSEKRGIIKVVIPKISLAENSLQEKINNQKNQFVL